MSTDSLSDIHTEDEGQRLSLTSMGLTEIPDARSLSKIDIGRIETLDLSDNELESISNLEHFTSLKTLILDNNSLSSLSSLPILKDLQTLWINNNQVLELDALLDCLNKFPELTYLSLLGNPCCPLENSVDYQHYRYWVLYKLKNLKFLDMSQVTEDERKKAASQGRYSRVIRFKPQVVSHHNNVHSIEDVSQRRKAEGKSYIGYTKHVYKGISSEGNRFICNPDL